MKGHDGQARFFSPRTTNYTYCLCNFCLLCSDKVWIASGSSKDFPGEFSRDDPDLVPGGGLGAARFFKLLGGVEDLDPDDPGSCGSGVWMTLMFAK